MREDGTGDQPGEGRGSKEGTRGRGTETREREPLQGLWQINCWV